MSKRRRWAVGLLVLLAAGAVADWPRLRRGQPDLLLVFAGYTNIPLAPPPDYPKGVKSYVRERLFNITNTGSTPVNFVWNLRSYDLSKWSIQAFPSSSPSCPMLKPGESLMVRFNPTAPGQPWRSVVGYTRFGLVERVLDQARNSKHPLVRGAAKRLSSPPKLQWAYSDFITDPPRHSHSHGRSYHITAPPPPMRFDLTGEPQPEATVAKKE